MGLGLLGRGIGVAKFLAENGARLTITDLKTEDRLASSLKQLEKYKNQITYVLGQHRLEDFENKDLIIKTAGVPVDSPFIAHAKSRGVPIEMDASLFARLVPEGVVIIGITGTRGKSTTTHLIAEILKSAGKRVFLGGNVRGVATLPLLNEVRSGDFVVLELDSWQLQGFGEAGISPQFSVFTNLMPDHMNYYKSDLEAYFKDKANIFLFQKKGDVLVVGKEIAKKIKKEYGEILESNLQAVDENDLPTSWNLKIPGVHNRFNAALARQVGLSLDVKEKRIKQAIEGFEAVEGRLQYLGTIKGAKVFNDNNATTPEATVAGIDAVADGKNIILIIGGADKALDTNELLEKIRQHCVGVMLLSGSGTAKIKGAVSKSKGITFESERLEDLVVKAVEIAKPGLTILFSPAFASFSKYFENEYERNDCFVKKMTELMKT